MICGGDGRLRPALLARGALARWACLLVGLALVVVVFVATSPVTLHDTLFHLRHEDDWPELDPPEQMPRRCAAKQAALELTGIDPHLRRISLPPWEPARPSTRTGIAYLAPCGLPHRLGIVARTFGRLYREEDFFYYQVDRKRHGLQAALVERLAERFGGSLPSNVVVSLMPQAGRVYYWGHTANVLAAMHELLKLSATWEWLVHLHDGAYPVHSPEYMRHFLDQRRGVNFAQVDPWDSQHWQAQKLALVHLCGYWVGRIPGQEFPQQEVQASGFRWAQGGEWWVFTRQLASYFVDERMRPYFNLMKYRINVEEILWASTIVNIPNFGELVSSRLIWETFNCQSASCRDTRHSPMNLDDGLLQVYMAELQSRLPSMFFVRTVTPSRSENVLAWLDARINWEVNYYTSTGRQGFPTMPHVSLPAELGSGHPRPGAVLPRSPTSIAAAPPRPNGTA